MLYIILDWVFKDLSFRLPAIQKEHIAFREKELKFSFFGLSKILHLPFHSFLGYVSLDPELLTQLNPDQQQCFATVKFNFVDRIRMDPHLLGLSWIRIRIGNADPDPDPPYKLTVL
jgi:hypothetical protein